MYSTSIGGKWKVPYFWQYNATHICNSIVDHILDHSFVFETSERKNALFWGIKLFFQHAHVMLYLPGIRLSSVTFSGPQNSTLRFSLQYKFLLTMCNSTIQRSETPLSSKNLSYRLDWQRQHERYSILYSSWNLDLPFRQSISPQMTDSLWATL